MKIFSRGTLRDYWLLYPETQIPLVAWYEIFSKNTFNNSNEIKSVFRNCSVVGNNNIVFNICGNKFRLIVKFKYSAQFALVRFIGTHAEYDKIKADDV